MRRHIVVAVAAALVALGGAAYAVAGGGTILDDGRYVEPGSLDDGRQLLPQTTISLAQAVAAAQKAADGALGQVDLEQHGATLVYKVDVGDREVSVDAADGSIAGIDAQEK